MRAVLGGVKIIGDLTDPGGSGGGGGGYFGICGIRGGNSFDIGCGGSYSSPGIGKFEVIDSIHDFSGLDVDVFSDRNFSLSVFINSSYHHISHHHFFPQGKKRTISCNVSNHLFSSSSGLAHLIHTSAEN
jgi:hypothetical protein